MQLPLPNHKNNVEYMAWHNAKTLNPIMNFWNLWVKGFQTVYRLPEAVDVLEEALNMLLTAAPTYMYTRILIPWIFWVPVWGLPAVWLK